MPRDLTEEEKRTLAFFEASVEAMNRMQISPSQMDDFPRLITFTLAHDILDEGMAAVLPKFK